MGKIKDKAIEQENLEKSTMRLWDKVSKTDVDHTKEVSFGRKFTAIDAHSQIMEATKLFGPVGEGWGYTNEFGTINTERGETYIWCDLTLWWSELGQWEGMAAPGHRREFGPIRGLATLQGIKADGKPKPSDHDAAKKAMTDALTKGLSHIGFNADVFLGMFDDNKYVQDLKKEKVEAQTAQQRAYQEDREKFIKKIKGCTSAEQIDKVLENHNIWIAGLPAGTAVEIRTWAKKQQEELS